MTFTNFISDWKPRVTRIFGLHNYCLGGGFSFRNISRRNNPRTKEGSAVSAEAVLVELFNGVFVFAFSANVDSGQFFSRIIAKGIVIFFANSFVRFTVTDKRCYALTVLTSKSGVGNV